MGPPQRVCLFESSINVWAKDACLMKGKQAAMCGQRAELTGVLRPIS